MNRTVLIVDERASVLAGLCTAFARAGYAPRAVQSFRDASAMLEFVAAGAIVATMELGSCNGLNMVLRSGTVPPVTKIVVMGPASASVEEEARALGASAYLRLPVDAESAVDTVRALLAPAAAAPVRPAPSPMRDLPIFLER